MKNLAASTREAGNARTTGIAVPVAFASTGAVDIVEKILIAIMLQMGKNVLTVLVSYAKRTQSAPLPVKDAQELDLVFSAVMTLTVRFLTLVKKVFVRFQLALHSLALLSPPQLARITMTVRGRHFANMEHAFNAKTMICALTRFTNSKIFSKTTRRRRIKLALPVNAYYVTSVLP
jgi:hypothetical protein